MTGTRDVATTTISVHRWTRSSVIGSASLLAAFLVLAALPYLVNSASIYAMVDLFILLILAVMWNLLAGYGGMVSIGQQAYVGIGAYGLVSLADIVGLNVFVAVPVAALICGILAIPISFLAFRLVGGYFAVGTWVIAEVLRLTVSQVPEFGAGAGISLRALAGIDRDYRVAFAYWAALAVVIVVIISSVLFVRSRRGLALTTVRDDAVAAATSGVAVSQSKRIVFVASAMGCGAAGALIALSTLRVQPDSVFSVQWSAFMIFIVVLGGIGTLEGPIIGAVVFFALKLLLVDFGPLYLIVVGVIGILVVLFAGDGIWGLINRRRQIFLFPVGYRVRQSRDGGRGSDR